LGTHISRIETDYEGNTPSVLALSSRVDSCAYFTNVHDHFFCVTVTSLTELFSKIASRLIIDFIKETGFYRKFKCISILSTQVFIVCMLFVFTNCVKQILLGVGKGVNIK